MRPFAGGVLVQHHGAGVTHDVGIVVGQNLDIVAGRRKRLEKVAVETGLHAQRRPRRAPRPPQNPARAVERFGERLAELHMAREHGALRLRLAVAAHGAIGHDAAVL